METTSSLDHLAANSTSLVSLLAVLLLQLSHSYMAWIQQWDLLDSSVTCGHTKFQELNKVPTSSYYSAYWPYLVGMVEAVYDRLVERTRIL